MNFNNGFFLIISLWNFCISDCHNTASLFLCSVFVAVLLISYPWLSTPEKDLYRVCFNVRLSCLSSTEAK
jgi:hypothetical protein